jgi:anti-sigma regulatory factor (Ser/Thr protein kinase)
MGTVKTQLQLDVQSRGAMSGILTLGSLDPAFEAASRVDGEAVYLDLRGVSFVEPAGICGLAALLEYLIPRSEEVNLALSGRDVPAYLERMDFFRLFGGRVKTNADIDGLEERQRHNPGTLQELVNFHAEGEIPGIIHRISEILENRGYRLRERVAICSVLSEICANAAEHGASHFGAFAAVQAYNHIVSGSRRRGEEVLISIADGGPGVRATLAHNPAYAEFTTTDNDALRHALAMGVTGTGEIGRGGGLALVAQLAGRAGGSLSIRSGTGRVTAYEGRKNSRNVPNFPGTFVRVSLPRTTERKPDLDAR